MSANDSIIGQIFQSRDDQYEPGRQVKILAVEPHPEDPAYLVRTEANPRRPDRVGSKSYISARTLKSRWRKIETGEPEAPAGRVLRRRCAAGDAVSGVGYRIEFTIQRRAAGDDDFVDIGFGSSGAWDDTTQCAHMLSSAVQSGDWETAGGMPHPGDVIAEQREREGAR